MPVIRKERVTVSSAGPAAGMDGNGQSVWDMIDTMRVLIYGISGSGKSRTAATFPGPTLWLICSGGDKPGELKSIKTPENIKKITPKIITSSSQMYDFIEEGRHYATVVIDHASGVADLVLKEILGVDELPAQKSWGMATQQNYGQQSSQCKELFRKLLNLSGNVVFIAQERTFGGNDEGFDPEMVRPKIGPALTPSLAGWLMPAVDVVVQTFKREQTITTENMLGTEMIKMTSKTGKTDFCLRTGPHHSFYTKFRSIHDELPDFIVNPNYTKIKAISDGTYK